MLRKMSPRKLNKKNPEKQRKPSKGKILEETETNVGTTHKKNLIVFASSLPATKDLHLSRRKKNYHSPFD